MLAPKTRRYKARRERVRRDKLNRDMARDDKARRKAARRDARRAQARLLEQVVDDYVVANGLYAWEGFIKTFLEKGKAAAMSFATVEGHCRKVRDGWYSVLPSVETRLHHSPSRHMTGLLA